MGCGEAIADFDRLVDGDRPVAALSEDLRAHLRRNGRLLDRRLMSLLDTMTALNLLDVEAWTDTQGIPPYSFQP